LNILNLSLIYRLADRFFFNPAQIGTYIALGQVFYFLGCNLYHRFGSAFNPVKVFSVSASIVFLVSIPLGFTRTESIVYASYWLLHLSTGFFWPPVMAWLTGGLEGKELNRTIGIYNRSWMAGNIFGPLIAGSLYQWNSELNFALICFFYLLVLPFIYLVRRRSDKAQYLAPATEQGKTDLSGSTEKKLAFYRYRGWISGLSSMLFLGVLINISPIHIRDGLGYTEASAGMILFLRCVASFVGFAVLARFTAWHFNRRWLMFLNYALMFCTLLLILAGNWFFFYIVVALLYGFVFSACYNNSMFYSGATGGNPKKNLAMHEIFLCTGNAAGTAIGGLFYQHFRLAGAGLALFLCLGLCLGISLLLSRKENKQLLL